VARCDTVSGVVFVSHIMQLSIMLNAILLVGIYPLIELRIEATQAPAIRFRSLRLATRLQLRS
jgi:hypothetical protein